MQQLQRPLLHQSLQAGHVGIAQLCRRVDGHGVGGTVAVAIAITVATSRATAAATAGGGVLEVVLEVVVREPQQPCQVRDARLYVLQDVPRVHVLVLVGVHERLRLEILLVDLADVPRRDGVVAELQRLQLSLRRFLLHPQARQPVLVQCPLLVQRVHSRVAADELGVQLRRVCDACRGTDSAEGVLVLLDTLPLVLRRRLELLFVPLLLLRERLQPLLLRRVHVARHLVRDVLPLPRPLLHALACLLLPHPLLLQPRDDVAPHLGAAGDLGFQRRLLVLQQVAILELDGAGVGLLVGQLQLGCLQRLLHPGEVVPVLRWAALAHIQHTAVEGLQPRRLGDGDGGLVQTGLQLQHHGLAGLHARLVVRVLLLSLRDLAVQAIQLLLALLCRERQAVVLPSKCLELRLGLRQLDLKLRDGVVLHVDGAVAVVALRVRVRGVHLVCS